MKSVYEKGSFGSFWTNFLKKEDIAGIELPLNKFSGCIDIYYAAYKKLLEENNIVFNMIAQSEKDKQLEELAKKNIKENVFNTNGMPKTAAIINISYSSISDTKNFPCNTMNFFCAESCDKIKTLYTPSIIKDTALLKDCSNLSKIDCTNCSVNRLSAINCNNLSVIDCTNCSINELSVTCCKNLKKIIGIEKSKCSFKDCPEDIEIIEPEKYQDKNNSSKINKGSLNNTKKIV